MKAIMFDFDGTLTKKSPNIWRSIWEQLGLDTSKNSYYSELFMNFINKKITYQEWCDCTCEQFSKNGMDTEILENLADKVQIINGANKVFAILKNKGISLHIVSGNIESVIKHALGDNIKYFDTINANHFCYDENGKLTHIEGTNYDYEGKAKFIREFMTTNNIKATEICFVGNGDNDEWAHLSGCKTICINPDETDETNSTKWHVVIHNVTDLREILPELIGNY